MNHKPICIEYDFTLHIHMCKNLHEGTFYILLIHILPKLLFLYFPPSFFDSPSLRTGGNKQCRNMKERFCGWSKAVRAFSKLLFSLYHLRPSLVLFVSWGTNLYEA